MTTEECESLANVIETLATEIESNTQEMKALRDAIDDLRTEYVHAIRNADCPYLAEVKTVKRILPSFPLDDALEMDLTPDQIRQAITENVTTAVGLRRIEKNTRSEQTPESIACAHCDVASPDSLAVALQEGWIDLIRDDGPGWNYIGICPTCQAERDGAAEAEDPHAESQKQFFT